MTPVQTDSLCGLMLTFIHLFFTLCTRTVFEAMEFTEIIEILRLYNGDVLTLSAPSLKNSGNFSIIIAIF